MPAGITGLWQVTARAHATFGEALDMDVAYARGWSLGLDLRLLCRTPLEAFGTEGDRVSALPKPPRRNGLPAPLPLPVRVAVVGLGYWGPNLVRNLHELPEAEVADVCDGRPEPLEAIRRRYPAIPGTRSFEAVLDDPTVDAVAIATPVSTHFELASRALERGQARLRREAARRLLGGGARADRDSPEHETSC